jgi:flagellar biosynthesis/type III secretory pathway protein FliH
VGRIVRDAAFAAERYRLDVPAVQIDVAPAVSFGDPLFPGDGVGNTISQDDDGPTAQASPEESPEPTVDLKEVRKVADGLIESGRREAALVVAAAKAQAQQTLLQAQTDAADIRAKAEVDGTAHGQETGRAQAAEEARAAIATMRDLIESSRSERRTIVDGAEPEVVKLALSIAERILHREIEVAPNVVLGMVRAGLARLSGREKVTVRVNPGDLATMREHREAFQNTADVESLRIVEDQRVDRGGVVIETESGTIDAKIGTQLREVRRVFAPDEPVALPAAGENPLRSPAQAS